MQLGNGVAVGPIVLGSARPAHIVDMTTSVCAEGKVRVAHNKGESLPEGRIIDHDGNPSTDPEDFVGKPGGAILPFGGPVAYKGYCLGMVVEVLGGALGGQGTGFALIWAWPSGRVSVSDGRTYTASDGGEPPAEEPWTAAEMGIVSELITPGETRAWLARAFELLAPGRALPAAHYDRGQQIHDMT